MESISKILKNSPLLLVTLLISIIAVFFIIYMPFQVRLFSENVVAKVYYVDNISKAHLQIIKKFNKKYKGEIEVVPVNLPFSHFTTNDRKEILTRSLRSRSDGIDIFAVDLIWIPRFAKWGFPMDGRFDNTTLSRVNTLALKACTLNNTMVAFPLFLDLGVLYYRRDLIRDLPGGGELEKKIQRSLTWKEFITLGKRFNSSEYPYYIFTGGNFEGLMCCFHEMLSDEESSRIFDRKPIELNTPSAERALKLLVDMIHLYKFAPPDVTHFDEFNSYLYANDHNSVFLRGWVGYHKQYKGFLKDTSNVANMEIAPLPHFEGHKTSAVFGGWSLMISKFSNRKKEALKFINFLFQKENQEILYDEGGYLPINDDVYKDTAYLKDHEELLKIKNLLTWGRNRPSLENYTKLSEIMSFYFHKALKREISVDNALTSATLRITNDKTIVK